MAGTDDEHRDETPEEIVARVCADMYDRGYRAVDNWQRKVLAQTKVEGLRRPTAVFGVAPDFIGRHMHFGYWYPAWAIAITKATDVPIRQRIDYVNYVSESPGTQIMIDTADRLNGEEGVIEIMDRDLPLFRPDDIFVDYIDDE